MAREQKTLAYRIAGQGFWTASALLSNPTSTTVIVDSGPLPAGEYLFAVSGASDTTWVYDIQHRNAGNSANIASQRRRPPSNTDDFLFPNKITLGANERVRVVLVDTIAGELQMSLYYEEVS